MFPDLRRESSRMAMGFRIFSFVCIAVCVAAVSVNWILGFHSFWSGYGAGTHKTVASGSLFFSDVIKFIFCKINIMFHRILLYNIAVYILNTGSIMDKTILPTTAAMIRIIHGSSSVTILTADCSAAFS